MKALKIAHFVILGILTALWLVLIVPSAGPLPFVACFWALILGYAAVTTLLAHSRAPLLAIIVHGAFLVLFVLGGWGSLFVLFSTCGSFAGLPPLDL